MVHVSDDGDDVRRGHFPRLPHQRGEELGLPVAAADVVIQLAAARVAERLRAVEAAEAFGERVIGPELAKKILGEWITLTFKDGSSTPKVQEMIDIEAENLK